MYLSYDFLRVKSASDSDSAVKKLGKKIIYPLFCQFAVFGCFDMGISVLNFHEKRLHRISIF